MLYSQRPRHSCQLSISCAQYTRNFSHFQYRLGLNKAHPTTISEIYVVVLAIFDRYTILYKNRCMNTARIRVDRGDFTLLKKVFHAFYSRRRSACRPSSCDGIKRIVIGIDGQCKLTAIRII